MSSERKAFNDGFDSGYARANKRIVELEAENEMFLAVIKCGATMKATADHYLQEWLDNFETRED